MCCCDKEFLTWGYGYGISMEDYEIDNDKLFALIKSSDKFMEKVKSYIHGEELSDFEHFSELSEERKEELLEYIAEMEYSYSDIGYKARIIADIMTEEEGYEFIPVHDEDSGNDFVIIPATCPWDTNSKYSGLEKETVYAAFERCLSKLAATEFVIMYRPYQEYVDCYDMV